MNKRKSEHIVKNAVYFMQRLLVPMHVAHKDDVVGKGVFKKAIFDVYEDSPKDDLAQESCSTFGISLAMALASTLAKHGMIPARIPQLMDEKVRSTDIKDIDIAFKLVEDIFDETEAWARRLSFDNVYESLVGVTNGYAANYKKPKEMTEDRLHMDLSVLISIATTMLVVLKYTTHEDVERFIKNWMT